MKKVLFYFSNLLFCISSFCLKKEKIITSNNQDAIFQNTLASTLVPPFNNILLVQPKSRTDFFSFRRRLSSKVANKSWTVKPFTQRTQKVRIAQPFNQPL